MMTISQMLADPAAPAWAQAILSGVAIVASGAIAVFVPQAERERERRRTMAARIRVTASTIREDVLKVYVAFLPEERNTGVIAKITVLEPANVVAFEKFLGGQYDPTTGVSAQSLPEVQKLTRTIQRKLVPEPRAESDFIYCTAHLVPNNAEPWDRKARIRVQAWTDVSPTLLSERTLYVSAFQH